MIEQTFVLPDTSLSNWVEGSRVPDVMYYQTDRLATYKKQHLDWKKKPYMLIPDLAVEVVSPNDRYSEVYKKVETYLGDGVQVIWVVDPQRQTVVIHIQGSNQQTTLSHEHILTGDPVIPGFKIDLATLFE